MLAGTVGRARAQTVGNFDADEARRHPTIPREMCGSEYRLKYQRTWKYVCLQPPGHEPPCSAGAKGDPVTWIPRPGMDPVPVDPRKKAGC